MGRNRVGKKTANKIKPYEKQIYDMYWNKEMSFEEIGKQIGFSKSILYRYMKQYSKVRTKDQQLQQLKRKNTGRVWTEETKENVRKGVQNFYNRNKGNFYNKDGTPKSFCPYKGLVKQGKERKQETLEWFEYLFGDVKDFLQREYVENGKSLNVLSDETGFSQCYISSLLKRYGFTLRDKGCSSRGKKHPMSEKQKEKLKKIFSEPEVKKRRSEAQKEYWKTVSYEDRVKRTKNGCVAGFNAVNSLCGCSSIEFKVKEQLDDLGIRYIQQKQIFDGERIYYLDFYLPDYKLVIECNGDYWHNLPNRKYRDKCLKKFVESTKHKIVFIWEHEINDEWFWIGDYLEKLYV